MSEFAGLIVFIAVIAIERKIAKLTARVNELEKLTNESTKSN